MIDMIRGMTVVIAIGSILLLVPSDLPWSDSITIHRLACSQDYQDRVCHGREQPLGTTKYRVDPSRAEVVVLLGAPAWPERYSDCTIFDKKNWQCPVAGLHAVVVMQDGLLDRISLNPPYNSVRGSVISVPRWWYRFIWVWFTFEVLLGTN